MDNGTIVMWVIENLLLPLLSVVTITGLGILGSIVKGHKTDAEQRDRDIQTLKERVAKNEGLFLLRTEVNDMIDRVLQPIRDQLKRIEDKLDSK